MDALLFWILFGIGIALGAIPLAGSGYATLIVFVLSDSLNMNGSDVIGVMMGIVLGGAIGLIIGVNFGFLTAGLMWLWGVLSFGNLILAGVFAITIFFNGILGMTVSLVYAIGTLGLGIAGFNSKSKKMERTCISLLGKEMCIGKED